jgi:type I restriction enzyme, S subunit
MSIDWPTVNLGEVLTLKRGYDLPTSVRHEAGNIPVISSSGISGFHDVSKVEPPGVVTGRYGSVGAVFYVTQPFWPLNTTLYVRDFKGNHPLFIYYLLQRIDFDKFSDKTGVPGVNRNDLHRLSVILPSLSEQHYIADILATQDRAISLTEQLIVAKQQHKRGLMQQLLKGKRRFGEFANMPWPSLKAGDIFQSYSKRNNGDEELLSVTQERGVIPRFMLDTRVVMPGGETASYKLVEQGDFIISLRSFQGGIEYSEYRGLVSPAYTILKPKQPIVDSFYKHLFKSQDFISHLGVAIIGIRDGKQINFEDFAAIRLANPPIDEQKRIAEVLDVCDRELVLLNRKLKLLKEQKQGLMQQLLTGKVRVKI